MATKIWRHGRQRSACIGDMPTWVVGMPPGDAMAMNMIVAEVAEDTGTGGTKVWMSG